MLFYPALFAFVPFGYLGSIKRILHPSRFHQAHPSLTFSQIARLAAQVSLVPLFDYSVQRLMQYIVDINPKMQYKYCMLQYIYCLEEELW